MNQNNLERANANRRKRSEKFNLLRKLQDEMDASRDFRQELINAWAELTCRKTIASMAIQNLSMQIEELDKEFDKL